MGEWALIADEHLVGAMREERSLQIFD